MTNGMSSTEKPSDLSVPTSCPLRDSGSSGIDENFVHRRHSLNDVLGYLQSLDYMGEKEGKFEYEEDKWDCEDMAFWGIAHVRCKFPGYPIAAAIGFGKEGDGIAGKRHALILLWHRDNNQWKHVYFEPNPQIKGLVDFDTKIIIPFPPAIPNSHSNLAPFGSFSRVDKGSFILDREHNFERTGDIQQYLKNKTYDKCRRPTTPKEEQEFKDFRLMMDKVFWAFVQARKEFKGSPIGYAIGTYQVGSEPKKDVAMLVLWEASQKFKYWHVDDGDLSTIPGARFDPRIIIA